MTGNELLSWYVHFSQAAMTLAANLLVQSTLIVGAGLAAAGAARKRGIAVQSSLLRVTLLAVLLCPLASRLLGAGGVSGFRIALPHASLADPNVHAPVRASLGHENPGQLSMLRPAKGAADSPGDARGLSRRFPSASGMESRLAEGRQSGSVRSTERREAGSHVATPHATGAERGSAPPSSLGGPDMWAIVYGGLTAAWLLVVGFLAARLGVAHWWMWAAVRAARPADRRLTARCAAAADALGIRPPRLLVSRRVANPCLVGWRRPAILLPSNTEAVSEDVLMHELAHLERRDCLWNLAGRLAASVLFFQPLLWVLTRRLAQAAEDVCDDYVIANTADRGSYARQLVDIAERLQLQWPAQTAGVGVVSFRSSLSRRVGRILDTSRCLSMRTGGGALAAIATLGLCASVLVGLIGARGPSAAAAGLVPEAAGDVEAAEARSAGPDAEPLQSAHGPAAATLEEQALARADAEGAGTEDGPKISEDSGGQRILFQGRVLGPDGQPLAGAGLYVVTGYGAEAPEKPPVRATTAGDGAFRFEVAKSEFDPRFEEEEEEYVRHARVAASAEGYGPDWASRAEDGQITLRLAKDDVPIRGRLVDSEGKPIAGVTVKVIQIQTTAEEDLAPWVEGLKTAREARPLETKLLRKRASPSLLGHLLPPVQIGPDGTCVLKGVGRERMVTLRIDGPAIATSIINVMTRPAERVELPDYEGFPGTSIYYGAKFEHRAAPAKPIVGVVRDKDTGKPLAGVTLRGAGSLGGSGLVQWVETTSDAEGRYRLTGLPRRPEAGVVAIPPSDQPYLLSELEVKDVSDSEETALDFKLKRGIWIEGKVTDKVTGKPVKAGVFYFVFFDNPHAKEAPGLCGAMLGWIDSYYIAPEGSFRCVGLPGRGLIAVRVPANRGYRMGVGADQIKGGKAMGHTVMYSTAPYHCLAINFNTLVEINPTEDQDSYRCDVLLDPGHVLTGKVLDPDGKPLAGALVCGGTDLGGWAHSPLPAATFAVDAYDPTKPRLLLFIHHQRRLAGSLVVEGEDPGGLTARLQPWGVIAGRVVDADGAPQGGVKLVSWAWSEPEPVPKSDALTIGSLPRGDFYADDDGRFRIEGLVPGLKYNIAVQEFPPKKPRGKLIGQIVFDLTLEPGETKDLGDVQLKKPAYPRP